MSFRKIYLAIFFAFCTSFISLEAMHYIKTFVRWPLLVYAQQKFVTSYYEFKKRETLKRPYSTPSYNNYFSLFTYIPKLYVTLFRFPRISQFYLNQTYQNHPALHAFNNLKQNVPAQNSTPATPINKQLEQKTLEQRSATQPPINLLDAQDKKSVELINQLMNIQDQTLFKTIGKNFLQLQELNQNYPELAQLMSKHLESPNTTTFVEDIKQLAKQKKLPPQFKATFKEHKKKIKAMGNWEYYTNFLPTIYKKF